MRALVPNDDNDTVWDALASKEAAGGHATTAVPIAGPDDLVRDVRRSLVGKRFDYAGVVAIIKEEDLVGLVSIEDLLAAPEDTRASDLMDPSPSVVSASTDQEHAASMSVERGDSSVAVVSEDGEFGGVIPPGRLLSVLQHEHEEDMARLGGYMRGTSVARRAAEEPVLVRYWHKLPWLMIGLLGTFLAADIVSGFEGSLRDEVILAFFLPGVVYLADAVGTQTETVIIRGMSANVPLRRVVRRELLTGLMVGFTLAVAVGPLAVLRWDRNDVALAVSLSLFAACSVASIVAMVLPAAFQRLGRDPAFGSGPLATVVQDLLSIVIYLVISTTIVN